MKKSNKPAANASLKSRWVFHPVPEMMKRQQGLPDTLPVPRKESHRLDKGSVTHGEIARWIENFLAESPDHSEAEQLRSIATHFAKFQSAANCMTDGHLDRAREILEELVQEHPQDALSKLNLATVLVQLTKGEEALKLLEEISPVYMGNVRYILILSRALAMVGRREEMLKLLWEANNKTRGNSAIIRELQMHGELVPMVFNPFDLSQMKYVTRAKYLELVQNQIDAMKKAGKYDQIQDVAKFNLDDNKHEAALLACGVLLEKDENDVKALTTAGLAECRRENWEAGEERFSKALSVDPENPKALAGMSRVLAQTNRTDEARESLRKAFAKDPNYIEAAELLVLTYPGNDERLNCALELQQQYPDAWVPLKLIGDLEFGAGQTEDALEKHRQAFAMYESDDTLTMILHELDRLDRLGEAVDLVEKTSDISKRSAAARWNAANVYLKIGRVKPAMDILKDIVKDQRLPHDTRYSATTLINEVEASLKGRH